MCAFATRCICWLQLAAVHRNTIKIASSYGPNKIVHLPEQKKRHSTSSVMTHRPWTLDSYTMDARSHMWAMLASRCIVNAARIGDTDKSLLRWRTSGRCSIRLRVLFDTQASFDSDTRLKTNRKTQEEFHFNIYAIEASAVCAKQQHSKAVIMYCFLITHFVRSPNFVFIIFSLDFIDEEVSVLQRGLVPFFNSTINSVDLSYFLSFSHIDTNWQTQLLMQFGVSHDSDVWLIVLSLIDIFGANAIKQWMQMKLFIKFFHSDDAFSWAKAQLRWMSLVNGIIGRENILQSNPIY